MYTCTLKHCIHTYVPLLIIHCIVIIIIILLQLPGPSKSTGSLLLRQPPITVGLTDQRIPPETMDESSLFLLLGEREKEGGEEGRGRTRERGD